jgi:hypothetical protein
MFDQIKFNEHPALADFGARNFAPAGLLPQGDGMNAQQGSRSVQVEGVHREG